MPLATQKEPKSFTKEIKDAKHKTTAVFCHVRKKGEKKIKSSQLEFTQ